ncbi:MAG: hypothetical protein ACE5HQ_03940 [Gemmatimonadota bacterium]
MRLRRFFQELRRRHVWRVAATYLVVAFLVLQVGDLMFPTLRAPEWAVPLLLGFLIVGFPVALVLAWAFEISPGGVRRTATEEEAEIDAAPPAVGSLRKLPDHDDRPSVAVLPFDNYSPDPDNAFFADGLTEEIIADLSAVHGLRVISRSSVSCFRGKELGLPAIAAELGVRYVLEGSVRRAGDSLRVTGQLIDAETDSHLWAEKYDGTLEDVFGIQESISRQIVGALRVTLTESEEWQVSERPIDDVVAHDYYLRARQEVLAWTAESQDRALQLVDEALRIVGQNALLLSTKGLILWTSVQVMIRPRARYLDQAAELAERALALDPNHFLAVFLRGVVNGLEGHTESALADLHRAHQLRPGDSMGLLELCRFSNSAGARGHLPYVEEAVRLDPLTKVPWLVPMYYHLLIADPVDALDACRAMLELGGPSSPAEIYAAWAMAHADSRAEAIELLERVRSDLAGTVIGSWAGFLKHGLAGERERALAEMTPELHDAAQIEFPAWTLADGYALVGCNGDALHWLEAAIRHGFINYPFLSERDPFLEGVRGDPRFRRLMAELEPRWAALAGETRDE